MVHCSITHRPIAHRLIKRFTVCRVSEHPPVLLKSWRAKGEGSGEEQKGLGEGLGEE